MDTSKRAPRAVKAAVGVGLTASVSLFAVGAAYAYFAAGPGTGSGTGKTGSAPAITLTAVTVTGLYPGGTADLVVKVTNPYPNMALSNLSFTAGTITADKGGCTAGTGGTSGVTIDTSATANPTTVSASANQQQINFVSAVMMSASTNSNSCQGATFTIPVTVSAKVG